MSTLRKTHTPLLLLAFGFGLAMAFNGCRTRQATVQSYNLPKTLTIPPKGWSRYLTPQAFLDSLNHGMKHPMYFLKDFASYKEEYFVAIPGMQEEQAQAMLDRAQMMSRDEPIILTCIYGDDSKRIADMLTTYGYHCYYLDGGTYRLKQQMERNKWKIPPASTGSPN